MNGHPLVSVYIPTHDRKQLLRRAVLSVLEQSYRPIELIVIDDGSTDGTEEEIAAISKSVSESIAIRFIRNPFPVGAPVARNLGIEAAAGELITGLDDDDYMLPGRIASLVAAFDPTRHGFVFDGYFREWWLGDRRIARLGVPMRRVASYDSLLRRNYVGNQVLTLTDRLRAVGGFDPSLPAWQDYDLWIRLARAYGAGRPVGGMSYCQTIAASRIRISSDLTSIRAAFSAFRKKHVAYADSRLDACLKLSLACYGDDVLALKDLIAIFDLREPWLVVSASYFLIRNKVARWLHFGRKAKSVI